MADLDRKGKGTIACQESNGRAQAYGAARCGTRVIWLKLDCLNPNLQQVKMSTLWIIPGTLEALIPGRMQGHGGTEEVSR